MADVNGIGSTSVKMQDGRNPASGTILVNQIYRCIYNGTDLILHNPSALGSLEYKSGLDIANGTDADHDINVSTGSIWDTNLSYQMVLASSLTKQIDATFAVGTNSGGLSDDDTLGNATWYGVFLLSKSTDVGDCDVIIATTKARSLSDAAATSAGFDISRLIGYVLTDGSANITPFIASGADAYVWDVYEDTGATVNTSGVAVTVSAPPFTPAQLTITVAASVDGSGSSLLTSLEQTNSTATSIRASVKATTDGRLLEQVPQALT